MLRAMLEALVIAARDNAGGATQALSDDYATLLESAPPLVGELITLLGTRNVRLRLGWRSIESRYLGSLANTWELVEDPESEERADELSRGVQIGASAGGEVYFGLCWTGDSVSVVEIDFEEAFMTWYDSVAAFFEFVRDDDTTGNAEGLAAIFGAAGRPVD